MTATQIIKIVFLLVITACAFVTFGSGFFIGKRKYKNNQGERNRKLLRLRAICFLIMLVMLLIVIII